MQLDLNMNTASIFISSRFSTPTITPTSPSVEFAEICFSRTMAMLSTTTLPPSMTPSACTIIINLSLHLIDASS